MTHSMKLLMAALALHATYTSLFRCSALLMASITLESVRIIGRLNMTDI